MTDVERRLGEVADPDGRLAVLLARIWEDKVARDHPELREHLDDVLETVSRPITPSPIRARLGAATTDAAWARVGG